MEDTNNLNLFKENLLRILISYFGKNLVLLNNVVELSDGVVTNFDDLTTLVAIITGQSKEQVRVVIKEVEVKNCCLKITTSYLSETLPSYRQVEVILIYNEPFNSKFPDLYKMMEEKFNISLNYVLIENNMEVIILSI
jgi:NH3-dependent NAD+ synthetase